jgi:DNA-binding response OmpR family regulator
MHPASILVTDDESNIRMLVRTALECDGYNVIEAANGRQAMEVLKTTSPQLMVLDLNMPDLDGMAVLEQLKQLAKAHKPRVIVLTA